MGPHNYEAEAALLGSIFMNGSVMDVAESILPGPEAFYKSQHSLMYEAMQKLALRGKEIDWITVRDQLTGDGHLDMADTAYMERISEGVPVSSGAHEYATIIADNYRRRTIIQECQKAAIHAKDMSRDVDSALVELDASLFSNPQSGPQVANKKRVGESVLEILDRAKREGVVPGWSSGNETYDRFSLGYFPGAISAVAASTGEGKTFFAWHRCLSFMLHNPGLKAGIISGEMSAEELVERQVVGDEMWSALIQKRADSQAYGAARGRVEKYMARAPEIVPMMGMRLEEVASAIRQMARVGGCSLIFVDYLQMIRSGNRDPNEGAFDVCDVLKESAKRLGVQIVLLTQLTKEGRRTNPMDLSESDIYGGSAFMCVCHTISTLMRPSFHRSKHPKIGAAYTSMEEMGLKPEEIVLERVIKSRRGAGAGGTYMTGHRIRNFVISPLAAAEMDRVKGSLGMGKSTDMIVEELSNGE